MELFYRQVGNGTPLIILHGLLGLSDNWYSIAKNLGEKYRVYLPDLRNHGRSPHSSIFNYEVMARDVREFLDTHRIASSTIVGHSMGGKVAMYFALQHPAYVEKLVVVDIAPRAYAPQHEEIFEAIFSVDLSPVKTRQEVDALLAGRIKDVTVRRFLLKNLIRDKNGTFRWKFNLQGIFRNIHTMYEPIHSDQPFLKPTLFIKGEKSLYITEEDIFQIKKLFPEAQIRVIPGAGHWVHFDKPDKFIKILRTFLDS